MSIIYHIIYVLIIIWRFLIFGHLWQCIPENVAGLLSGVYKYIQNNTSVFESNFVFHWRHVVILYLLHEQLLLQNNTVVLGPIQYDMEIFWLKIQISELVSCNLLTNVKKSWMDKFPPICTKSYFLLQNLHRVTFYTKMQMSQLQHDNN